MSEQKMTEQEREQLAAVIYESFNTGSLFGAAMYKNDWRNAAEAAFNTIAPRVRAEALKEALAEPTNGEIRDSKADGERSWDDRDHKRAKRLFANRLQRLTAKPDPLREAVHSVLEKYAMGGTAHKITDEVMAVVRADSGGGR